MLIAITQPARDALPRGALAHRKMAATRPRIAEISGRSEALLMSYLERFDGYRNVWLRQGWASCSAGS